MLCALFKSYLLFAVPRGKNSPFEIVAVISLSNVQIDKADNGRGEKHNC